MAFFNFPLSNPKNINGCIPRIETICSCCVKCKNKKVISNNDTSSKKNN